MKQDPALPTGSECRIIRAIDPEGSVPNEDILAATGWKKNYLATLLGRLKRRGYVEVDYLQDDVNTETRYAFWSLTEMGLAFREFLLDWGIGNV